MTSSPARERHLHADDDRLLADIEVAEAADQPHAVELARLLLEAADQQHVVVGAQQLVFAEARAGLPAPLAVDSPSGQSPACINRADT